MRERGKPFLGSFYFLVPFFLNFLLVHSAWATTGWSWGSSGGKHSPIIIGVSGFNSCRSVSGVGRKGPRDTPIYQNLIKLHDLILATHGIEVDFMASCFMLDGTLVLTRSWDEQDLHGLDESAVRQAIFQEIAQRNTDDVYLVGHSWGGWVLMDMLRQLNGELGVRHLFTIDPISKVQCNMNGQAGCTSAPRDIIDSMRDKIQAVTGLWGNFYQTKTFYLHSGPIDQADFNMKVGSSHSTIDEDHRVWSVIWSKLDQDLNGALIMASQSSLVMPSSRINGVSF